MAGFFPQFVDQEGNDSLLRQVTTLEILATLQSFQRDKFPSLDGCLVKFYLGFYVHIGGDLLKVVEEYHREGFIHPPLNSNFIALIPKKDSLVSFKDTDSFIYAIVSTR